MKRLKLIIVTIIWLVTISGPFILYFATRVPSDYVGVNYTVASQTEHTRPNGTVVINYLVAYKDNGKVYTAHLSNDADSGPLSSVIYYNPDNPSSYKMKDTVPIFVFFIPACLALLITFLMFSKKSFMSNNKQRSFFKFAAAASRYRYPNASKSDYQKMSKNLENKLLGSPKSKKKKKQNS